MADPSCHIVVAEPFEPTALERLRAAGRVTVLDACDESRLVQAVRDCEALLVRSSARVTRKVLESAERLRVIGRGGTGLDNVDLEAARERGITVVFTPGAATEAVADLTIGLIIALVRKMAAGHDLVRRGLFGEAREQCLGVELSHLTLGIIGLGRIGRAVAKRCRYGFGMRILYNDIVDPGLLDFAGTPADKTRIYREADVVSLHVPLTARTRGLIDEAALSQFKPGAVLINTSRGAVVNGDALARALCNAALAGAALDVFDPEPLPGDHPLMHAPNTLFTPHIGARTMRSLQRMNRVVSDVVAVLHGRPPRHPAFAGS